MGDMTLSLEGWRKREEDDNPVEVRAIHFHIDETLRLLLEDAEEELQSREESERYIEVDNGKINLETSPDCGTLSDCHIRVYRDPADDRCHFHLVGHRASDNSLVYSNAVLIDNLA